MPTRTYELHGVRVASPWPLDALPASEDGNEGEPEPDLVVTAGEAREASGRPEGNLIAELEMGALRYWLAERPDGSWLMRYHELAEFEIDGPRITAHPNPNAPTGYLPIVLAGGVIARILSSGDRYVLHAGAVEIGGRAVALVGQSGAGKSTTTAHLCLAGTPLFSDDTLAVDLQLAARPGAAPPRCFRGTNAIRLREAALPRFQGLEQWSKGYSADDRLIVAPPFCRSPELELAAVITLERSTEPGDVIVERLHGSAAATAVLGNTRAIGWTDPARVRKQFELATTLSERTVVLKAQLPDRPASEPLGAELLTAIEAELAVAPARLP